MPYPKTAAIRLFRRERAEAVQARSTARPLAEKIRDAGRKELAKLIVRLGESVVRQHRTDFIFDDGCVHLPNG